MYILIVISIFLDGIISTLITQESIFIPYLLITTLFFVYPKYQKKITQYNLMLVISGIIYDLLYTNLLFFHATIFLILGKLINFLYKTLHQNTIINILSLIIVISTYIILIAICLFIFRVSYIAVIEIIQIIIKSLLINIIYLLTIKNFIKVNT